MPLKVGYKELVARAEAEIETLPVSKALSRLHRSTRHP